VPQYYKSHEPQYLPPIAAGENGLLIRNDKWGKGAFGASRGGGKRKHAGVDLEAPLGADVFSSKSGRVIFAEPKGNYGNLVRVLHWDKSETRYAHMQEIFVQKGAWISAGKRVGAVGKTGNADIDTMQSHIHFEIRQNDCKIDPMKHLKPAE